jgi:hypothetical protein
MSDMEKQQSNSDNEIATLESTGAQIFKAPESSSDVVVTASALIAIAIVASYVFRLIKGKR